MILLLAGAALAAPLDLPLPRGGTLAVSVDCGALALVGHDAQRVLASGDDLDHASVQQSGAVLQLSWPDAACAEVTVQVPRGTRLAVDSRSAAVHVEGVEGAVEIETGTAPITVVGRPQSVEARTVSGQVRIDALADVHIETVSGPVEAATGPGAQLSVVTVSGPVWAWGGPLRQLEIETVSADARFQGAMQPGAAMRLQSHSGDLGVVVPPGTTGDLRFRSFSGKGDRTADAVLPVRGGGAPFDALAPEVRPLWARIPGERTWSGKAYQARLPAEETRIVANLRTFSGDLRWDEQAEVPAATGGYIGAIEAVDLSGCGAGSFALRVDARGRVEVTGGAEADCLREALADDVFPTGAEAEIHWTVPQPG